MKQYTRKELNTGEYTMTLHTKQRKESKRVSPKMFRGILVDNNKMIDGKVLYTDGSGCYGITDFPSTRVAFLMGQSAVNNPYARARLPQEPNMLYGSPRELIKNETLQWQCPECDAWNDNYEPDCRCGATIRREERV